MPNPKSRHYALRTMYAHRRKLLATLKDAVWKARTEALARDCQDPRVVELERDEARLLAATAYYEARAMFHWAGRAQR